MRLARRLDLGNRDALVEGFSLDIATTWRIDGRETGVLPIILFSLVLGAILTTLDDRPPPVPQCLERAGARFPGGTLPLVEFPGGSSAT